MATSNTNAAITDAIIKAEGGSKATNFPHDPGGRTQYGISEAANPEAWEDGKVTHEEARAIYEAKYLVGPGFDRVPDERLRHLLVDFGVHSGPAVATARLQEILRVDADGVVGPATLKAIEAAEPRLLINKLAIARLQMLGRLITKRPKHAADAAGWINRVVEFLIP